VRYPTRAGAWPRTGSAKAAQMRVDLATIDLERGEEKRAADGASPLA